jgi:hypothetical protein
MGVAFGYKVWSHRHMTQVTRYLRSMGASHLDKEIICGCPIDWYTAAPLVEYSTRSPRPGTHHSGAYLCPARPLSGFLSLFSQTKPLGTK